MPKLTRKPLPEPFTADAAVLHLYRAWTGQGKLALQRIELRNPRMVNALAAHFQREHPGAQLANHVLAEGILTGIGRWTLLSFPGGHTGALTIEYEART
jgi:hypothetical protein